MTEIIEALNKLEKEKGISKEIMIESIEKAIISACEKDFGKDAVKVVMDPESGEITVTAPKQVVDEINDFVECEIKTLDFGRIAAQKARGIILQNLKENERKAVYDYFKEKENTIITGIVQRRSGYNLNITLDEKTETMLSSREMIPGERYNPGDRIKLYIVSVKLNEKGGFRIITSRTHPNYVKLLFEREVSEIKDGTVEIMNIAREAGSRSKLAVWSNDPDVDAVGACVGLNSIRINNILADLADEKIDIIEWDENPAVFIENALRPAPVISVDVDEEAGFARVVVPDDKLSLAIGKEGQNARLAAKLTNFKIDIKSQSQAAAEGDDFDDYDDDDEEEITAVTDEEVAAAIEEAEAEANAEESSDETPAEESTDEE